MTPSTDSSEPLSALVVGGAEPGLITRSIIISVAFVFSAVIHTTLLSAMGYWYFNQRHEDTKDQNATLGVSLVGYSQEQAEAGIEKLETEVIEEIPSDSQEAQSLAAKTNEFVEPGEEVASAQSEVKVADSTLENQAFEQRTAGSQLNEESFSKPGKRSKEIIENISEDPLYQEVVASVTTTTNDFSAPETASQIAPDSLQKMVPIESDQQQMLSERLKQWRDDIDLLNDENSMANWESDGQTFSATLKTIKPSQNTELERAIVEISTEVDGVQMTTQVELKRMAFSHFAQIVDRWDPTIVLSKDKIDGRFHSNSRFFISDSTEISGKTTVSTSITGLSASRRSKVFPGGIETRVRKIDLPDHLLPILTDEVDQSQVHRIRKDSQIRFYADGQYDWFPRGVPEQVQRRTIPNQPYYIVGSEDSELDVEGVVNGQVVLYSQRKINITGDIAYADNPEANQSSDDYLGLISDKYVEIAPPAVTGYGDLNVYASIYAKRRFLVRRYRTRSGGLLKIYGSMTAGTLSATEPRFSTDLRFDKRLENKRPPNFPMTNKFELDRWDAEWRVSQSELPLSRSH